MDFVRFSLPLIRAILSLRYKIEIKGLNSLSQNLKGTLFLANHTAYMDPMILLFFLWPKFKFRPLTVEYISRIPILKPWLKLFGSISIPNFDTAVNAYKIKRSNAAFEKIVKALKEGDNILIYPSSRLKKTSREIVGGASGTQNLLQKCPQTPTVLIRTTGFWGSSFSWAPNGQQPNLFENVKKGISHVLKNLLFFTPRRKITIELEEVTLPTSLSRLPFNQFLENWYNQYTPHCLKEEPLYLVSYSCWKKDCGISVTPSKTTQSPLPTVTEETRSKIYKEIGRILRQNHLVLKPEMHLATDLGMDSINIAELAAFLFRYFNTGNIQPAELTTVGEVLRMAQNGQKDRKKKQEGPTWPPEKNRPNPAPPNHPTIPEAFLHTCHKMKSFAACGDDLAGALTYRDLKLACLALADHLRKLPDQKVGVLLPASVGAYVLILSLQLCGKVPVLLNWTLGPRNLAHMVQLSELKTIISSWRFIDQSPSLDLGEFDSLVHFLEDIRASLSWKNKFSALFGFVPPLNINENDPAVILFTSGSESFPKGVPLSHKNILSNLQSILQAAPFLKEDAISGVLPPFHALGLSVVGISPLIAGIKISWYPDPTDGYAMAAQIERWKSTVLCNAPMFLKSLFESDKEKLTSLRLIVSGADRTPPELYQKAPTKLIDAYGVSECSPGISIGSIDKPQKGVGFVLPGVLVRTIHPETQTLLPQGQEGELCVHGPNVFSGYLGSSNSSFIQLEGKKWHRTGDLGYIDAEGYLYISGRIKHFAKIGGEMISLKAIEDALRKENELLAVCAKEKEGRTELILFTTSDWDRERANECLSQAGFSNLVKISRIQRVDEIPLLGSGKVDYRRLSERL